MAQLWHDINDPGAYNRPAEKTGKKQPVQYETDQPEKKEKQDPEVKLVSAKWTPGEAGFEFNKKCTLSIHAEFLKKTFQKKITCSLFVLYNGNEEDVKHKVDAYLDNDGNANADMTLYYGNEYYDAAQENPEATCQYKAKIEHPTATAVLESDLLDMPKKEQSSGVFKVRIKMNPEKIDADDDAYLLFSTDEKFSYSKTLTVKDDKIKGDDFLDLEFNDLIQGLSYSLKVLPGNKEKGYLLFNEKPYKEIV